jgi:nicotinamide-nucleotide amidase
MGSETIIARLLTEAGLTLATAESLTGGRLGHLITTVPGASNYYKGGVISYATETKQQVLGVDAEILAKFGPVSRETALAMAVGVRRLLNADIGLSTTGVAGPTEQDGHPVGTLYVGIADSHGVDCFPLMGTAKTRDKLRDWAANEALTLLSKRLHL